MNKETIITFNDQEDKAYIFSSQKSWMNKIKKVKGWYKVGDGVEVEVPKSAIKFPSLDE